MYFNINTFSCLFAGGFYIRTQFSSPGVVPDYDREVILTHPTDTLHPLTEYCLSFWYHMESHDPGTLTVYLVSGVGYRVWKRDGRFGDRWLHGEVYISEDDLKLWNTRNNMYEVCGETVAKCGHIIYDSIKKRHLPFLLLDLL